MGFKLGLFISCLTAVNVNPNPLNRLWSCVMFIKYKFRSESFKRRDHLGGSKTGWEVISY
jgi:hypothetical protein